MQGDDESDFMLFEYLRHAEDNQSSDSSSHDFDNEDLIQEDVSGPHQIPIPTNEDVPLVVDLSLHISSHFFTFDRETYALMVSDLHGDMYVTLQHLKECKEKAIHNIKKWRKMKDGLALFQRDEGFYLCLKAAPHLLIAPKEEWEGIIKNFLEHESTCGINEMVDRFKCVWCANNAKHGMPVSFIKAVIQASGAQKSHDKQCMLHSFPDLRTKKDEKKIPTETIFTDRSHVEEVLANIMVKFQVRLVEIRSTKAGGPSKSQVEYGCHRGGKAKRGGADR